jgi:hypothetical protein
MSYTYTVEDIIDAAVERNQMNDRTVLAGDPELVLLISRKEQRAFLDVAKASPDYFGAVDTLTLSSNDADLTELDPQAARIVRVEVGAETGSTWATGDEIFISSRADVNAEVDPKMYRKKDTLVGDSEMSTVTNVVVYYAIMPDVLASATSPASLNLSLPDQHCDVLITEVAYYLALKDNRSAGEIELLKQEIAEAKENLMIAAALADPLGGRFA